MAWQCLAHEWQMQSSSVILQDMVSKREADNNTRLLVVLCFNTVNISMHLSEYCVHPVCYRYSKLSKKKSFKNIGHARDVMLNIDVWLKKPMSGDHG